MAVIGINYNEFKSPDLGYKSVYIRFGSSREERVFDSGNFCKDWYECNKFIIQDLADKEPFFSNSSSVDHFIMDGAPYRSAYLKSVDQKGEEWYLDYEYDFQNPGIEYFVEDGTTPTWEEFRKLYSDLKL